MPDFLTAETLDWLLEEENPSVRYFALKDLLDLPEGDAEVQCARCQIMKTGPVQEILQKQNTPEYRAKYPAFYTGKYASLVWQTIVLAELGATPNDLIREQCGYLLRRSQEKEQGGFSQHGAARMEGGLPSEVIPCLTGNMVFALLRLGLADDPAVQKSIGWITRYQRFDDGDEAPSGAPYDRYEMCWGRHTCHMGVVKALKALAEIPEENRTKDVRATLAQGVEYLLKHHVFKRSHNLTRISKPGWNRFGFPLMYQTDTLEVLDILTALGVRDGRMQEAVDLVASKQGEDGRWKLENTYNDSLLVPIEQKGAESKWVTLRALRVLKRYYA